MTRQILVAVAWADIIISAAGKAMGTALLFAALIGLFWWKEVH